MISQKTIKAIEFDKIMQSVASYAVLERTKSILENFSPLTCYEEVCELLSKTEEAYKLLYNYSIGGIYYFDDISEELDRVDKQGTLNNAELLRVASNLKSARILKSSIDSVSDESIILLREINNLIYVDLDLEKEITDKIISEDAISDNASPELYQIRKNIRNLNAKIRERLNSYIHGGLNKYLQDAVVTIRQDRYVIPVKSEYRSFVKGFIHDQSASGSTVFIEPEQVMELNNELKRALLNEQTEIIRILSDLSDKVSSISNYIRYNAQNICKIDECFAKAQYSFYNRCSKPLLNNKGKLNIIAGRHPLISKDKIVPVSVSLGQNYNFLLVSGPNTGGKTVTLKLVGLLSLMAMSGLYVPAADSSEISVFNNVFCDIGDEQSIEQNLSTFSSHIKNIISIIDNVDEKSLVLIDEIGAGTDPDEGCALAIALLEKFLSLNCFGIITTHYSKLKEFAIESQKIENASMEFDPKSLKPLYRLNIGIPGSSNAIDIARTLGLSNDVLDRATASLSENKINFENIIKKAEESRRISEKLNDELDRIKQEQEKELTKISEEREKITKERERIYFNAKQETKRIVSDKLSEAEEIVENLKYILKQSNLSQKDVFRASELRNRLKNSKYLSKEDDLTPLQLIMPDIKDIKIGCKVFIKSLNSYGVITSLNLKKKEVEITIGSIKSMVKISDIFNVEIIKEDKSKVKVSKASFNPELSREINVIGKDSIEALDEVKLLIDKAVVNGFEEIKVIHGVGEGILLKTIRSYLKTDKNVKDFRRGNYGEGENGVTIIKLK
ncbi:MAG: endonuclease MutS2 [Clostridia bacterium]|nr:endonuclease MutS2 [Clostridia bacterium]